MTQPPNIEPPSASKSGVRRLGVLGTFVWDVIHPLDPAHPTVEGWGGITYALSALDAALSDDWAIVPIIQVGSDLATPARAFLETLRHLESRPQHTRLAPLPIEVPYPNNRVTLRYHSSERRHEYLSGGIPGWKWDTLRPLLQDIDALYVNLISGMELDLKTAQLLRQNFSGVIYCDIHSLLLGAGNDGLRTPRIVPEIAKWLSCFDIIQVNEDEMALMAPNSQTLAELAIGMGASVVNVTLGSRGVLNFTASEIERLSDVNQTKFRAKGRANGPIRTSLVPTSTPADPNLVDPTGCGDVWGGTYFARLLVGDMFGDALIAATTAAVKNVNFRGVAGLADYLRGETAVK